MSNLLTNGGFESGGFTPWASSNAAVTTAAANNSAYGAQLSPGGILYQDVNTVVSQTYRVTAKLKITQTLSAGSIYVKVDNSNFAQQGGQFFDASSAMPVNGWITVDFTFVATTPQSRVWFRAEGTTIGVAGDDFVVASPNGVREMLVNGGFEQPGLAGWQINQAVTLSTYAPFSGMQSARLTTDGLIYQEFTATVGTVYTTTARVRLTTPPAPSGQIEFKAADAGWGWVNGVIVDATTLNAGSWTTFTFAFTPTTALTRLVLREINGAFIVDLDNVSVTTANGSLPTPTPAPTPTPLPTATPTPAVNNLLTNGGFESNDLAGWAVNGIVVQTSAAYAGGYGAHIATNGLMFQDFATVSGQMYYVSARMRINQSLSSGGIVTLRASTDGWGWLNEQSLTSANGWATVAYAFVAQTATSRLIWRTENGTFDTDLDSVIVSSTPIASAPMQAGGKVARFGAKVQGKLEASTHVAALPQATGEFVCASVGLGSGCKITSYYSFGGQRVAMRVQRDGNASTVTWLHSDHLGSASLATDATGAVIAQSRYKPFGEERVIGGGTMPTDRRFDGMTTHAGIGLTDFGARMLSPIIGRWLSADTVVPRSTDPQALNRYAFVRNSPFMRTDPDGHCDKSGDNWCYETKGDAASQVSRYAIGLRNEVAEGKPGGIKPVEALAKIADMAWLLGGSVDNFMWIITVVVVGVDPETMHLQQAYQEGTYGGKYWVSWDMLPYGTGKSHYSQPGDWNPDYMDGTANQGFHFLGLAALAYYAYPELATIANNYHDPVLIDSAFKLFTGKSFYNNRDNGDLPGIIRDWASHTTETSQADLSLGVKAVEFGSYAGDHKGIFVGEGIVKRASTLFNPGAWIRQNLAVSVP